MHINILINILLTKGVNSRTILIYALNLGKQHYSGTSSLV
jgi:hypothetical protein